MTASGREQAFVGRSDRYKPRQRNMQINRYGGTGDGVVKVPRIYWEYCTKGVLTMEWIEGIKLTNRDALVASGFDIKNLVDQVLIPNKHHTYILSQVSNASAGSEFSS